MLVSKICQRESEDRTSIMVRSDIALLEILLPRSGDDGDDNGGCKHIKIPANHLEKMLETKDLKGCEVKI